VLPEPADGPLASGRYRDDSFFVSHTRCGVASAVVLVPRCRGCVWRGRCQLAPSRNCAPASHRCHHTHAHTRAHACTHTHTHTHTRTHTHARARAPSPLQTQRGPHARREL
jgi:hypothetical protein